MTFHDVVICEYCRDRNGSPKQSYKTRKEAFSAIDSGRPVDIPKLHVYPCPYENVWHITRK